ncbi:hypothetical protein, partial [Streptomyces sp. URMC 124]|uniref:hypothetical protein n=1 Tax=Streptomyces sp. URMC 124 TaxID=3423405 RepID=UPI003F529D77
VQVIPNVDMESGKRDFHDIAGTASLPVEVSVVASASGAEMPDAFLAALEMDAEADHIPAQAAGLVQAGGEQGH